MTSSQTRLKKLWKIIFCCLAAGFAFCIFGSMILAEPLLLLSGVSFVPPSIIALYNGWAGKNDLFMPLNFVFITLLFGVTIQTLYLCYLDDRSHMFAIGIMSDVDSLLTAIGAITLGILLLVIGYSIRLKTNTGSRKSPHSAPQWSERKVLTICYILLAISLIALAYYIAFFDVMNNITERFSVKRRVIDETTGIYKTLGYVRLGVNFSQISFFILFAHYLNSPTYLRTSYKRAFLWTLAIAGLAMPFIASSRLGIITFLVGAGAIHHFSTGGWPIRRLGTVVVVVITLVVGMGALRYTQSRNITYSDYRSDVSVAKLLSPILASSNFLAVGKTSAILEAVPNRLDYQYGKTYITWLVAPIPRSIWPDKPIIRIGGILGFAIFGTEAATGIPPGAVGELYLNFGWLGIPLGMLLLGMFLRWYAENFMISAYYNINHCVIFSSSIMFVAFTGISADFNGMVSMALQRVLPIVAVLFYISQKSRTAYRGHSHIRRTRSGQATRNTVNIRHT